MVKLYVTGGHFMEQYIPDIYQKSIYNINYDLLAARGIKCILMDLDNTMVPISIKKSNKKIGNPELSKFRDFYLLKNLKIKYENRVEMYFKLYFHHLYMFCIGAG